MYILFIICFPHLHISQESCTLFREPVHVEVKQNRRFRKYKVLKYNEQENYHSVSPEAGTEVAEPPRRMDLNALALEGRVRTAECLIPREVAQRWLAIAGGFRPDRGGTPHVAEAYHSKGCFLYIGHTLGIFNCLTFLLRQRLLFKTRGRATRHSKAEDHVVILRRL